MIPVLLIMTSNAPDTYYTQLLENYRKTLNLLVGPTEVLVSGDTLQLKDYSKLDWPWTLFDPEAKKRVTKRCSRRNAKRHLRWARRW